MLHANSGRPEKVPSQNFLHTILSTGITLNNPHHLGAHILIDIIRHGDAGVAIVDEGDCDVDTLEKALGVDAAQDEAAFVQGFGALGAGADAHPKNPLMNSLTYFGRFTPARLNTKSASAQH